MVKYITPTIKPEPKQHEAYQVLQDHITKFLLFGGGAGGGKTWLLCEWLLTNCYFYPGSRWFIGRNELKRLMQSTFVTWNKVCQYHDIPQSDWKLDGKYNFIEFRTGSRIDLLDCKYLPSDPEFQRFGSLEYTSGALEEAGEVHFLAFDVLKSRVGRHLNIEFNLTPPKILLTCNPIKNWLYQIFYKPWKAGTLPQEYAFIQALHGDNRHTADEYGKQLSEIKDKATKQRLMFGNWEYDDDDNSLMTFDAITDLFTNTVHEDPEDKYLICDAARYGGDKIVVNLWKGLRCYKIAYRERQGIDQTSEWLRELARDEKIPYSRCLIDEGGVGGGIVDNNRGMKGFISNSSPLDNPEISLEANPANEVARKKKLPENYRSLKDQCAFMLADKVNNHEIKIDCEDEKIKALIVEDLEQIKQKDKDKDVKLQIIPKDEVKELLAGRSPDFGDTLLMRMFFFLKRAKKSNANVFKDKPLKYR